jgi:hypothetical protein
MFKRTFVTDTDTLVKLLDNAKDAERTHKKARQEWDDAVHKADVTFYFLSLNNKHEACFFDEQSREKFQTEIEQVHTKKRFESDDCNCVIRNRQINTLENSLSEGEIEAILQRDPVAEQNVIYDLMSRCHDKSVKVHYLLIDAEDTMNWGGWRQHGFPTEKERDAFYERIVAMAGGSSSLLWQKVLEKLNVRRGTTDLHTFNNAPYHSVMRAKVTPEFLEQTLEYLINAMKKDLAVQGAASPKYSPRSPKYHD